MARWSGSFVGPFLINAIGAANAGLGYQLNFNWRNPEFREWVRLSIPLMLGVSLVSADDWILRYFASGGAGDITRLNYAKRLFALPISILGQAAGQASMPFFAKLFGEGRRADYADIVNKSVYRIAAVSMLTTALMIPAALPIVDLAFRRGRFTFADSLSTSVYFAWFSVSLALWSAQALYSRGLLCRQQYGHADGGKQCYYRSIVACLRRDVSQLWSHGPRHGVRHRHPDAHRHACLAVAARESGSPPRITLARVR